MATKNKKNVDYVTWDARNEAVKASDSNDEGDDGADDGQAGQHRHHNAEDFDTFVEKYGLSLYLNWPYLSLPNYSLSYVT